MTYCVASPSEIVTVSFWKRLFEVDWVVCNTDTVALDADTAEAILTWLTTRRGHPMAMLTMGHFHLFIETFSRDLGHAVPVVGPKFLSGAAASDPVHIRMSVPAEESSVSEFVSLLAMTETEQKIALFGQTAQVTEQVTEQVDTPAAPHVERPAEKEATDGPRVHHRPSGRRRHPKGAAAVDRQGQSVDSGQPTDDAAGTGTTAGPDRSEV